MINKLTRVTEKFSPNLRKIISNTSWLFGDQLLRMSLSLFVGAWLTRYLGPTRLGIYNYALALVGLFTPFANFGLNQIVVRDLVNFNDAKNEILGTAFVLKLVGGILLFLLLPLGFYMLNPNENLAAIIVVIIAAGIIFQCFEVIEFWFQSQVESKYTVFAKSTALIVTSCIKVFLIKIQAPLIAFVWTSLIEILLITLFLIITYYKDGNNLIYWRYQFSQAKRLVRESWPLILTGVAITIYMKIDLIMLGNMLGSKTVGIYSSAVRISELWYFIPVAITSSVFPSIVKAKQIDENLYYQRLQKLFNLMVFTALIIAVPMTFLSGFVVTLLFGQEYLESAGVLSIHIWAAIFVFLGVAQGPWNITEGLQRLSLTRGLMGAGINVVLNFILIPQYGASGAAIATLISYAIPNYFANFFNIKTAKIFQIQSRALFFRWWNNS